MENLKLIHQLFIGKVADEIGTEKTTQLLKEAKDAFSILNVVGRSEQYFCCKDQINQRCNEQCLGCFQFQNKD